MSPPVYTCTMCLNSHENRSAHSMSLGLTPVFLLRVSIMSISIWRSSFYSFSSLSFLASICSWELLYGLSDWCNKSIRQLHMGASFLILASSRVYSTIVIGGSYDWFARVFVETSCQSERVDLSISDVRL